MSDQLLILRRDTAVATATALEDMVCQALMPGERKDFYEEAVHIVLSALAAYDQLVHRDIVRLCRPSQN